MDPSAPNKIKGAFEAMKKFSLPNFFMALPTTYSFPTYKWAVSIKLTPYSKAFPIKSIASSSDTLPLDVYAILIPIAPKPILLTCLPVLDSIFFYKPLGFPAASLDPPQPIENYKKFIFLFIILVYFF